VIAADGGAARAAALGLDVALLVGDLDSIDEAALHAAQERGARIVRHPEAKDATDLELALEEAIGLGPRRVLVVLSADGRLDHLVAALQLLAAPMLHDVEVDAFVGGALVHVVRDARELEGATGELLTLVPLHGRAEGVTTEGLHFPLACETLEAGSSRGVSNVFTGTRARVSVERGVLLAIRPDHAGEAS
jgi:thiamine pyrophosphokinase